MRSATTSVSRVAVMAMISLLAVPGARAAGESMAIKANGSAGSISVSSGTEVAVTLDLSPGAYTGVPADWWVLAEASGAWSYYNLSSGFTPGFNVTYQGGLQAISSFTVLRSSTLSPGTFNYYFGVDTLVNGQLDTGALYYRAVTVNVTPATAFALSSSSFANGGAIPAKYCNTGVSGGQNISPQLQWTGAPAGARSFAVLCVDTHAMAGNWIHWAVVNIPVSVALLGEGASPGSMPGGSTELQNDWLVSGYGGPEPPAGSGTHTYLFQVYALGVTTLNLGSGYYPYSTLSATLSSNAVGTASITGTFAQ